MNTTFLLLAQHEQTLIPVETVAAAYFGMDEKAFTRRVGRGEIALPIVRMDPTSQKSPRVVHVQDLADWIDRQRASAQKEAKAMGGGR